MTRILTNLTSIVEKSKKIRGRGLGSGRGAKSGRGTTRHQKARENIPLGFEGGQGRLVKRFPLLRGKGRNRARKYNVYVFYTKDLNQFSDGDMVDVEKLKSLNLVDKTVRLPKIKIIANGKVEKKLTVRLIVSPAAKSAIEKAGGTVESV
ncbi:50S ribosomal protein L15 [Candidatus Roizmanbacteria bacterium CG_4_10_14_0_8_um_filter_39_9]|uniref:Large ribosomal subunit protein uL15 n=1 Tax=Candidatus Roizmanbacteria bacterium CG_4_10_14_0_8_um_filter_39_9 TaxID=1974829 RepID=A0A2M7QDA3_9BACT|nr:MAG: 50S ribosomal protein L15 [Candidatus Roizmanbacteria bacterium CG_4_10_14_0_8_um_filter_39_9]